MSSDRSAPLPLSADNPLMPRLYQAAIGPLHTAYYQQQFERFDAQGKPLPSWNWAAGCCTLGWMGLRGLWRPAAVYIAVLLVLAGLWWGLDLHHALPRAGALALALLLVLLAVLVPGLGGNALYHHEVRARTMQALTASRTLTEAMAQLQAQAPNSTRLQWATTGHALCALLAAALVWGMGTLTAPVRATASPPSGPTQQDTARALAALVPAAAAPVAPAPVTPAPAPTSTPAAVEPPAASAAAVPPSALPAAMPPLTAPAATSSVDTPVAAPASAAVPTPTAAAAPVPPAPAAPQAHAQGTRPTDTPSAAEKVAPASADTAAARKTPARSKSARSDQPEKSRPSESSDKTAKAEKAGKADKRAKADPATAAPSRSSAKTPLQPGKYYLNSGIYAQADNARRVVRQLRSAGQPVFTQVLTTRHGEATRIRVGPFDQRAQAEAAARQIEALHLEAQLFRHAPE